MFNAILSYDFEAYSFITRVEKDFNYQYILNFYKLAYTAQGQQQYNSLIDKSDD